MTSDVNFLPFSTKNIHSLDFVKPKKFTPKRVNKYKHKKYTWITLAILKSIRYRDRLRNKLKLMHADSHEYNMTRANLMAYNAVLKKCIRAAKQMHYESCFNKFKHNIRKTWDTINNILSRSNKSKNFPSSYIYIYTMTK